MAKGKVFLKEGGWGDWQFSYLIFSRIIIFAFTLPFETLCYALEEKNFSVIIILWKKLPKNKPENIS